MSRDVDSFLLDRVFQPAVDAAAEWFTCFGLARITLTMAVCMQTAVLAWSLGNTADHFRLMLIAMGTLGEYAAAQMVRTQINRMEKKSRPGVMNVARITYRPLRMLWVAFAFAATGFWLTSNFRMVDFFTCSIGVLWVLTVYFMCCMSVPPHRKIRIGSHAFAGMGA